MRFKPPPPNSEIGWRVEFRTMELSLTGERSEEVGGVSMMGGGDVRV